MLDDHNDVPFGASPGTVCPWAGHTLSKEPHECAGAGLRHKHTGRRLAVPSSRDRRYPDGSAISVFKYNPGKAHGHLKYLSYEGKGKKVFFFFFFF